MNDLSSDISLRHSGLLGSGHNWSNWQENGVIVQLMDIFFFSSEWLKEALRILQADSKCC